MTGYYLPEFNWSVRFYNGQWCLFARQPGDTLAGTPGQISAIRDWAASNRRKHEASPIRPTA